MLTFLFWNINRKPITATLRRIVDAYDVDVLLLAECGIPAEELRVGLNEKREGTLFEYALWECEAIQLFSRFPSEFSNAVWESERVTMRRVNLPSRQEILLSVAHLPSRLHFSIESLIGQAMRLSRDIRDAEREVGHTRTVLVGDLNMNPFEIGIVSAEGLHAVMTRQVARKRKRRIQGRDYPYFYNPMWGFFGDLAETSPGTYYYEKSEDVCYFWNIFDQVMIRPDLLPVWKQENLQILTNDGAKSLLTVNGAPKKQSVSDHLPILFSLDI